MSLSREVRLVLALALTVAPSVARADADLVVTRGDGAGDCPDADEVRRLALGAVPPSLAPRVHAYRVSFERSGGAYRAEIVDDTAGRARRLEDLGPGCGPLGQAAAQVVATMWSSERDDTSPAPPPSPALAPALAPPRSSEVSPSLRSRKVRGVFGAGAALAAGIVRPAAPAFFGDVALELAHASLALGALWIPAQTLAVTPGSIEVQLFAGSLRGCAFSGGETQLGVCAKVLAGAVRAEAAGYSTDTQRARVWLAIEPEVYVDHAVLGWLRGRAALGAVVPLRAETFSVTGAGAAYATPPVGGLASLSLEVATPESRPRSRRLSSSARRRGPGVQPADGAHGDAE